MTVESELPHIKLPNRLLENDTILEVDYPEADHGTWIMKARTERSTLSTFSYTVEGTGPMSGAGCHLYGLNEKSLRRA